MPHRVLEAQSVNRAALKKQGGEGTWSVEVPLRHLNLVATGRFKSEWDQAFSQPFQSCPATLVTSSIWHFMLIELGVSLAHQIRQLLGNTDKLMGLPA